MFGSDSFGPEQDYYATYRRLGGSTLHQVAVQSAMDLCLEGILCDYESPARYDDFPSLGEAFRKYAGALAVDLPLLEAVFAEHEGGRLSPAYAAFLGRLAVTHQMGVVSNICALPDRWIKAFEEAGVRHLFQALVFSSEGHSIKPSPLLFRRAMSAFASDARVLFVSDSLDRDIRPAAALGMATAWVAPDGASDGAADIVVPDVLALERIAA